MSYVRYTEAAMKTTTPESRTAALTKEQEAAAIAKQSRLLADLARLDSLLVAFSGGADSAYLAWAAHCALGERALAVTAVSPSFAERDRQEAREFARRHGLNHMEIETREFENPLYVANNPDRCYHCKDELFDRMEELARTRGGFAIAYGINQDDMGDFRPGHRAAREHAVLTPLLDAGLTKSEIRFLSRQAALETWDRPASACLSSRVPYGTRVSPEVLQRIERAEEVLREMGFRQVRVRAHGELARIEIAAQEIPHGLDREAAERIAATFRELGFAYTTLDLEGYRQGSLNILLRK